LTNTGVSAARFYWESHFSLYNAADVSIPAAVSVFPGENYQALRSWADVRITSSSITKKLTKAGTMQLGNSRNFFHKTTAQIVASSPDLELLVVTRVLNPDPTRLSVGSIRISEGGTALLVIDPPLTAPGPAGSAGSRSGDHHSVTTYFVTRHASAKEWGRPPRDCGDHHGVTTESVLSVRLRVRSAKTGPRPT
jgi:hypothetical protein